MTERIGIVTSGDEILPHLFLSKVNQHDGVRGEFAKLDVVRDDGRTSPYRVLVNRASRTSRYLLECLRAATLQGTFVADDPWAPPATDKFFIYSAAVRAGAQAPRTVLLPPLRRGTDTHDELDRIVAYVGLPAWVKPADGVNSDAVTHVRDRRALLRALELTAGRPMLLQEAIDFDQYVRVLCVGRELILPVKHDPPLQPDGRTMRYLDEPGFLSGELEQRVLDTAWAVASVAGFDLCSIELACQDGVPFVIDVNRVAGLDKPPFPPRLLDVYAEHLARFAIRAAREGWTNEERYAFQRALRTPVPRPGKGSDE